MLTLSLAHVALLQTAPTLTNADLRLVASGPSRVLAGEFVTVRTVWTARLRTIPVTFGAEWVEVDRGQGYEEHAEGGRPEVCPVSLPYQLRPGRRHVSEHLVGLEHVSDRTPELCCLEALNASVRFVFDRPGRYRVRVRYDDATSNAVEIEAVAPTGADAAVFEALRARPIVLTSMGHADPDVNAEAEALVRAFGPHRLLEPYIHARPERTHQEHAR